MVKVDFDSKTLKELYETCNSRTFKKATSKGSHVSRICEEPFKVKLVVPKDVKNIKEPVDAMICIADDIMKATGQMQMHAVVYTEVVGDEKIRWIAVVQSEMVTGTKKDENLCMTCSFSSNLFMNYFLGGVGVVENHMNSSSSKEMELNMKVNLQPWGKIPFVRENKIRDITYDFWRDVRPFLSDNDGGRDYCKEIAYSIYYPMKELKIFGENFEETSDDSKKIIYDCPITLAILMCHHQESREQDTLMKCRLKTLPTDIIKIIMREIKKSCNETLIVKTKMRNRRDESDGQESHRLRIAGDSDSVKPLFMGFI
jgi:hypothetical protein